MLDLKALAKECMAELDAISIPYSKNVYFEVNSRAKRRWGQCMRMPEGPYRIQISDRLLQDESSRDGAKNTIIHELLHSCPGGHGHKGQWKVYAQRVNNAYGYKIKRTNSSREKGVEDLSFDDVKYVLACKECGKEWRYTRLSSTLRKYRTWVCTECGGLVKMVKGSVPTTEATKTSAPVRYKFVCEGCGGTIVRSRASKFTNNYTNYHCKRCKGKFKQVI